MCGFMCVVDNIYILDYVSSMVATKHIGLSCLLGNSVVVYNIAF